MNCVDDQEPGRKALPHDPPPFIDPAGALFFITICCKPRGFNQLCVPDVAANVFAAARFYSELRHWNISLLLLMPDHLHMLASFNTDEGITKVMRNWKRYVAAQYGIQWQRDFFDHRLRGDESSNDKARYILENPVRAGLVKQCEDWAYQMSAP